MDDANVPSGFLARWSRRKTGIHDEPAPDRMAEQPPLISPSTSPQPARAPVPAADVPAVEHAPAPTLADVAQLTHESDYTRFVANSVDPSVKNAALKKLFTDPHFNVMDGLDTYIDDYGRPDPLPAGMLRKMVQAHSLGLFAEEDAAAAAAAAQEDALRADPPTLAETATAAAPLNPPKCPDEDIDLRLQPDDDSGCPGAAPGTREDAGCKL